MIAGHNPAEVTQRTRDVIAHAGRAQGLRRYCRRGSGGGADAAPAEVAAIAAPQLGQNAPHAWVPQFGQNAIFLFSCSQRA